MSAKTKFFLLILLLLALLGLLGIILFAREQLAMAVVDKLAYLLK